MMTPPHQAQERVIGYTPVYETAPPPPQPAPTPTPPTGLLGLESLTTIAVAFGLGMMLCWFGLDAAYGGADIRTLEAQVAQAEAMAREHEQVINDIRGALQCR